VFDSAGQSRAKQTRADQCMAEHISAELRISDQRKIGQCSDAAGKGRNLREGEEDDS